MKKNYLFSTLCLATFLLSSSIAFGQLLQWNTFGNLGTETTEPSVYNDPNISAANLTQGTITAAANGNRFGGNGWFNTGNTVAGNTLSEAIAGNDYIQFVVTPNAGASFTPSSLVFKWDFSGTGPKNVTLRSSFDNYTTDLGTLLNMTASTSVDKTLTITGLSNVTVPTTFRLYGYGATATTGTGGFDQGGTTPGVVNVALNGCTLPLSCPTLNSPANAATSVALNTPLVWTAPTTGGKPTGYKVYLGTAPDPTTLVSTVTAPTVTYTPSGQTNNTTYYWKVVTINVCGEATSCSEFSYTTVVTPPPVNNDCAGAISINGTNGAGTPTGTPISATTVGATQSMAATCGGDADDDIWFKFITDDDGSSGTEDVTITISATSISPVIEAFSGACGSLTSIACAQSSTLDVLGLTNAQTVYVRVYDAGAGFTGGGIVNRASGAFSIEVAGAALPITLKSFTATPNTKTNQINFTTVAETNNAYFNIERSADGVKFENIGRVLGNSTTAQEHNYSFTDGSPLSGVNYYRLQQVDFDGKSTYSKVVSVRFVNAGQVYNIYPNPATDVIMIETTEETKGILKIEIYNQAGALVKQMQYDAETMLNRVSVADLPTGSYIAKIMSGIDVTVQKFSKQ